MVYSRQISTATLASSTRVWRSMHATVPTPRVGSPGSLIASRSGQTHASSNSAVGPARCGSRTGNVCPPAGASLSRISPASGLCRPRRRTLARPRGHPYRQGYRSPHSQDARRLAASPRHQPSRAQRLRLDRANPSDPVWLPASLTPRRPDPGASGDAAHRAEDSGIKVPSAGGVGVEKWATLVVAPTVLCCRFL